MIFESRFVVAAPLDAVDQFHRRQSSLVTLTPPPIVVRIDNAASDGKRVAFTLWIGPARVRWVAQMDHIGPTGFVDTQLVGPYASWMHQHRFRPIDETTTEVVDRIEAKLARDPVRFAAGLAMWLGLPALFQYRALATRRALESRGGRDGRRRAIPRGL